MRWLRELTIRQKELLTGFIILFIIGGCFIGAELILRYKQIEEFGDTGTIEEMSAFHRDEKTGLRLPVPNAQMGKISFNNLGLRGPDLAEQKDSNIIRIGYLGSSVTFDAYTSQHEYTWPGIATYQLQQQFPLCKFEYFNAGIPGMGPKRLIQYYDSIIKDLHPDVILIMIDDRNGQLNDLAIKMGVYDGVYYRPSWLAEHSLFWAKIEKNAVVQQRIRSAIRTKSKFPYTEDTLLENYRTDIRQLINTVNENGSLPVLLSLGQKIRKEHTIEEQAEAVNSALFFMPYMSINDFIRTAEIYNQENERISRETNTVYLSWHQDVPGTSRYFIDSIHFTSEGSKKVGSILAHQLSGNSKFREALIEKGFSCLINGS